MTTKHQIKKLLVKKLKSMHDYQNLTLIVSILLFHCPSWSSLVNSTTSMSGSSRERVATSRIPTHQIDLIHLNQYPMFLSLIGYNFYSSIREDVDLYEQKRNLQLS